MAFFRHFGQNVCVIQYMPQRYSFYSSTNTKYEEFETEIKNLKYKYLLAVTANFYQKDSRETLQKQGFKEIITFLSTHGGQETLTLWVKIQESENKEPEPITTPSSNCTVHYSRQSGRFRLTLNKTGVSLKLRGWKNVDNTPIWYSVAPRFIVKKEEEKNDKSTSKTALKKCKLLQAIRRIFS
jgi:hypothetical protein